MADLIIKISGDVKSYEKALEDAQTKTEGLNDQMAGVARVAAVAFAALTAEAYAAVSAYAESQAATNQLTAALQQQGIYTKQLMDDYAGIAEKIMEKTGVDDDATIAAMANAQSMLGQTKITEELAMAVQDLATAKKMNLNQAYQLVAQGATVNTSLLKRYGIELKDTGDKTQNLANITAALTQKFGGQSEAAAQGLGGIQKLKAAFGEVQEAIGARLAPVVEKMISGLTSFFQWLSANKAMMDLAVSIGVATAAVAGIALVVAGAGMAFLKLKAALEAARIATSAMKIAVQGLTAATGIGILLIVVTEIALNWNSIWPRMQAVFQAFVNNIMTLAQGVGKMLLGYFTLDIDMMKEGFNDAKKALSGALQDYNTIVEQKLGEQKAIEDKAEADKEAANNAAAAAEEAREKAKAARIAAIQREKHQLMKMQMDGASAEAIKLQQEEIQTLEQMNDEKNLAIQGKLRAHLDEIRRLQQEQGLLEKDQARVMNDELLTDNEFYQQMTEQQQLDFMDRNGAQLQAQILNEKTLRDQMAKEKLETQVREHNEFLKNQEKFGTAYALINKIMHSEIYQGTKQAFGDLAQLQSSSNATLKGIGKAAALANVAIKTAEAAMNIYAGFATIPIIGPALGIAGAAAAVAFGAEQAGQITAAADGGLITGPGGPTADRIPAMLSNGELVVPARNFDEVVSAVAASRNGSENSGGATGVAQVILELKGELSELIEAKIVERQNLNIAVLGVG